MRRSSIVTKLLAAVFCLSAVVIGQGQSDADDTGFVYELRTYTTNEGKLDDLNARFKNHTIKLFEKHGITNFGYWVPTDLDKSENTLIYVIGHKNMDAAKTSWKAFMNDPDWKKAYKASEADGPILAKAPESVYMSTAAYTPALVDPKTDDEAAYELRIYKTNEGKLPGLDARFRDHTIKIFARHGIESIAYWHPTKEPEKNDTLIYILRHESRDAAKKSWKAFGKDPDWKKAAKESQKDGRFLREKPTSIYMKATDYSKMK